MTTFCGLIEIPNECDLGGEKQFQKWMESQNQIIKKLIRGDVFDDEQTDIPVGNFQSIHNEYIREILQSSNVF